MDTGLITLAEAVRAERSTDAGMGAKRIALNIVKKHPHLNKTKTKDVRGALAAQEKEDKVSANDDTPTGMAEEARSAETGADSGSGGLAALEVDPPDARKGRWAPVPRERAERIIIDHTHAYKDQNLISGTKELLKLFNKAPPKKRGKPSVPFENSLKGDFCWSFCWEPVFLARLAYEGFLNIASEVDAGLYMLMPKLHTERCVLQFADLHVGRSARKRSKQYKLSIDNAFEQVMSACVAQHGENWLYPPMRHALRVLNSGVMGSEEAAKRHGTWVSTVSTHSIEVWHEGKLVAGELGIVVSNAYSSLTGFHDHSSPPGGGTVQILAMCQLLQRLGFNFVDFGMVMPYKLELGAKAVPRHQFLKLFRDARSTPNGVDGTAHAALAKSPQRQAPVSAQLTPATAPAAGGAAGAGGDAAAVAAAKQRKKLKNELKKKKKAEAARARAEAGGVRETTSNPEPE